MAKGYYAEGCIYQLEKRKATLEVSKVQFQQKAPSEVILAQALPRINRLDFIVEKGTELGMTQLWLFPGHNSERQELSSSQNERVLNISIAAMKQCGRFYLPEIKMLPPIEKWLPFKEPLYFGDLHSDAVSFSKLLLTAPQGGIFCTGPESGFNASEEDALRALGAIGVKIHANVLRTDTASLAALTLMTQI